MPHVEEPLKYEKLQTYPHLSPYDAAIWERYITSNPGRFTRVFYDYRVGDCAECDPDVVGIARESWNDLTRWRIDVVAEDDAAFYVIELKPMANSKAIGFSSMT